jgi:hypothetical protein
LIIPPRPGVKAVMPFNPHIGPEKIDERLKMTVKESFAQKWLGKGHPKARIPATNRKIISGVIIKAKGGKEKKMKDGVPLKIVILAFIRLCKQEVDGEPDPASLYEFKASLWAAQIHGKHFVMTDGKNKTTDGSKLSSIFSICVSRFRMANHVNLNRRHKVIADAENMGGDDDADADAEVDQAVTEQYEALVKELAEKRNNPVSLGPVCEFAVAQVSGYSSASIGTAVRVQSVVEFCFKEHAEKAPAVVPLSLDAISEKLQDKSKLRVKEFRARLCADLLGFLVHDKRKQNVAVARHRILSLVTHHQLKDPGDKDYIQKLALQIYKIVESPDKRLDGQPFAKPRCTVCGEECQMPDVHFPTEAKSESKPDPSEKEAAEKQGNAPGANAEEEVSEELKLLMADMELVFEEQEKEGNDGKKVERFFKRAIRIRIVDTRWRLCLQGGVALAALPRFGGLPSLFWRVEISLWANMKCFLVVIC